ncbi:MAG: hypothetical protein MUF14_09395, partial [Hyphomonadaceae bacterium]|nr:hypothetical protein [Hyphomonadaceae bacterium]
PGSLLRGMQRAQDCERFRDDQRPPDCPPPAVTARQQAEQDRMARDRETTTGYSRAEVAAKREAGWRDRCELESGRQADVCITFGYVPPPPRTVEEHCQRGGIGGNCAPAPSQEAVDRARRQVQDHERP